MHGYVAVIDRRIETGRDLDRRVHLQAPADIRTDAAALQQRGRLGRAPANEHVVGAHEQPARRAVGPRLIAGRADDPASAPLEPRDPAVGYDARAGFDRGREECPRHRLLDGPAVRLVPEHARELDRTPAEFRRASLEHRRRRRRGAGEERDGQVPLDAFGIAVERVRPEFVNPVIALPFVGELGR